VSQGPNVQVLCLVAPSFVHRVVTPLPPSAQGDRSGGSGREEECEGWGREPWDGSSGSGEIQSSAEVQLHFEIQLEWA
jgi:hypothetical protein